MMQNESSAAGQPPPPLTHTPGGLPEPPNLVGFVWKALLEGGRLLGVLPSARLRSQSAHAAAPGMPVPDANAPQSEEEREEAFGAATATAASETFDDYERLDCVSRGGVDQAGRPILLVCGSALPDWRAADQARFGRYVAVQLAALRRAPFVLVYLHAGVADAQRPAAAWLWAYFEALPESLKDNLEALYVVHPAATLRSALSMIPFLLLAPFASGALSHKTHFCDRLEDLWEHVAQTELRLPRCVHEHDSSVVENPLVSYGVVGPPSPLTVSYEQTAGMPPRDP